MAPNYPADARALVIMVLGSTQELSHVDARAFEKVVAAIDRDLELKDMVEANAHRARLAADAVKPRPCCAGVQASGPVLV